MIDVREALRAEHSKAQTLMLTDLLGNSPECFLEIVEIVSGDDRLLAQRGAWVVSHCAEAHPEMVQPYLVALLENLGRPNLHDAVKRNTMKALELLEIPDDCAGRATDVAFRFLTSPEDAVAIKVYSMSVLAKICRREPELAAELRMVIEELVPQEKQKAFSSRARHVLKELDSL